MSATDVSNKDQPLIDVSNINEKVYILIRDRLLDLTYPPGHKINMRKLQDELNISQTPIKDALFRLAGEGLVEISSRRGTFAKQVTSKDLRELVETRIVIESGTMDLVTDKMTEGQLAELEKLFKATLAEDSNRDYRLFLQRDSEFHTAIIKFSGNSRLIRLYEQLNAHIQIIRYRFAPKEQARLSGTDDDHRRILQALKERDRVKAKQALVDHLQTVKDAFLNAD